MTTVYQMRNKMAGDRILLECRICGWRWFTRRYERCPRKCPNCLSLRWALGPWLARQQLERAQADCGELSVSLVEWADDYDDPEAA
jgi:hypothetical protein